MEIAIKNLFDYYVELIKLLAATSGIMGYKLKVRKRAVIFIMLCTPVIFILAQSNYFNSLSLIISLMAVATLAFLISGKYKLICGVFVHLSVSMLDIIVAAFIMFFTGYSTDELFNSFGYNLIANVSSVILILLGIFLRHILKKPFSLNQAHIWVAYIVAALLSQVFFLLYLTPAMILGFDCFSKPLTALSLSFSGLFFIIGNIITMEFAFSKRRFKSLYQRTLNQSENLTDYFSARFIKEKEKRKIYHDMPYHLLSVQSFLNSGNTNEAQKYVDMLTKRLVGCGQVVNTGNHQLNAIISGCMAKYPKAKIEISGAMPDELNFPRHDFCIILSNLLDNAFRMADMLSDAVKIEIKLDENTLYIHVVNPVERRVKIIDNTIHSAKYGQGIGNITVGEYLGKNGGKVFYRCSDKSFTTDLYLTI